MLLFIRKRLMCSLMYWGFNTSHVVIYHEWAMQKVERDCFNTSHVVIYQKNTYKREWKDKFQYISCCYLSLSGAAASPNSAGFNTSHVVIYPVPTLFPSASYVCFNTSHVVIYREKELERLRNEEFQYISCCYLSPCQPVRKGWKNVSIHLMLLFILCG